MVEGDCSARRRYKPFAPVAEDMESKEEKGIYMEVPAESTASVPEGAARPARPRRPWPLRLYTQELPRALRELRWALVVVVALYLAGAITAYFGYDHALWAWMTASTGLKGVQAGPIQRLLLSLAYAVDWQPWWPAFVDRPEWYGTWQGYLVHNTCVALCDAVGAIITLGLWAIRSAWAGGWHLTWGIGYAAARAQAATGLGVLGTALAQVAPHGALEGPAFWLVHAGALRAGLAWVKPRRGLRRSVSMARGLRDLGVVLIAMVPVLLAAGVLEATVAPSVRERYLLGIGAAPGMASERRVRPNRTGSSDGATEAALSPDGRQAAVVGRWNRRLWVGPIGGNSGWQLATLQNHTLGSPTFAPDGGSLAFPLWSPEGGSGLTIFDMRAHKQKVLAKGPTGRYLAAAWSPDGDQIAVVVAPQAKEPPDLGPANLWLVCPRTARWEQVTRFAEPGGLALVSGISWSPDSRRLAFSGSDRQGTGWGIWTVRKDGSDLRRVTTGPRDMSPSWSPHGDWIALLASPYGGKADLWRLVSSAERYAKAELALVRADGTGRRDHLAKVDAFSPPSWSADGQRLLYIRSDTVIEGTPKAP